MGRGLKRRFPLRCRSRDCASHPGCPHQRCQLHPEPHQSPIRIKATERASRRVDSSPWHDVPQTTVGSQPCPLATGTGCLAASVLAPTPFWLTAEASQSPRSWRGGMMEWELGLIGSAGSNPNPFASSQPHSGLGKCAMEIKGDLLAQHVITGPCQFVSHRLQRD